ncbi:MAG: hypothetical protein QG567_2209 [Campylobacterota bacterium]|nr:hypothetical protein [Campylobacterota bacterium]
MQRIGINNKPLEFFLWLLFIAIYQSLVAIYPYIPPLFGLMLAYLWQKEGEKDYFLVFFALLFFEANHSLLIFSTWVFAWFLLKIVMPFARDNISCKKCLNVLVVVLAYLLFYLLLEVFDFMLGISSENYDYFILLYYILIESILVFALP